MEVHKANVDDLQEILSWLKREYDSAGGEGFWCNRNIIENSLMHGDLWVVRVKKKAVAFQVGDHAADIACVRQEFQRQGFGKALFAASLVRAQRDNVNILWGECSPRSSFPFWKSLGFEQWNDPTSYEILVRRILPRNFELPSGRPTAEVMIDFYPEEVLYTTGVQPISEHRPRAAVLEDGSIFLAERVIGICLANNNDLVVRIEVDSIPYYFCKAKYDEAASIGVQRDMAGRNFFIDTLVDLNPTFLQTTNLRVGRSNRSGRAST